MFELKTEWYLLNLVGEWKRTTKPRCKFSQLTPYSINEKDNIVFIHDGYIYKKVLKVV